MVSQSANHNSLAVQESTNAVETRSWDVKVCDGYKIRWNTSTNGRAISFRLPSDKPKSLQASVPPTIVCLPRAQGRMAILRPLEQYQTDECTCLLQGLAELAFPRWALALSPPMCNFHDFRSDYIVCSTTNCIYFCRLNHSLCALDALLAWHWNMSEACVGLVLTRIPFLHAWATMWEKMLPQQSKSMPGMFCWTHLLPKTAKSHHPRLGGQSPLVRTICLTPTWKDVAMKDMKMHQTPSLYRVERARARSVAALSSPACWPQCVSALLFYELLMFDLLSAVLFQLLNTPLTHIHT